VLTSATLNFLASIGGGPLSSLESDIVGVMSLLRGRQYHIQMDAKVEQVGLWHPRPGALYARNSPLVCKERMDELDGKV